MVSGADAPYVLRKTLTYCCVVALDGQVGARHAVDLAEAGSGMMIDGGAGRGLVPSGVKVGPGTADWR